jgi:signal transduction histidine kinase/DNA-binding response OmpR family regulator
LSSSWPGLYLLTSGFSLKAKLVFVIMLTSGIGIVLACLGLGVSEANSHREELVRELRVLADIAGSNCTAALEFAAKEDGEAVLRSLGAKSNVITAAIYDRDGQLFAVYRRPSYRGPAANPPSHLDAVEESTFYEHYVDVARPIVRDYDMLGTTLIRSDLVEINAKLWSLVETTLLLLFGAGLLVWLLGSRLQRVVSEPIIRLSELARTVSSNKCYSARAEQSGNDEVGKLTEDFNAMLAEIETRDRELAAHQETLEARVVERTHQLELANVRMSEEKERAEAGARTKSEFLATMSHEIRTPIGAIIGNTELALDTELAPEQRDYLATVKNSSDALLAIVDDILDFSKIEAGRFELVNEEFDIRESIGRTLKAFSTRTEKQGLELTLDFQSDVPMRVVGDAERLRQILTNLIGNAVKFTETGEISVHVRMLRRFDDRCELYLSVRDTGVGIPEEKQALIFESFAQADGSTSRRYGGTGLGLAIAARLVDLLDGRIWVESQVGEGSTFQFTAGFGLVPDLTDEEGDADLGGLEGLRVLVVDDNPTNRRILEATLASWRMVTTVAESGERALELLEAARGRDEEFGLIILDRHMPGMDGLEVARRMRGGPHPCPPTIMMLPSTNLPNAAAACREIGVETHIVKPVLRSALLNRIMVLVLEMSETEPAPASESGIHSTRPLRVLLAEDNPVNQKLVSTILAKMGHDATIAADGRLCVETLARLGHEAFDIILMDMQMPEMNGLDATRAIRAIEARDGGHIPIVALTANALQADRKRCLDAGMDEYVSKPVRRRDLIAAMNRALDRSLPVSLPGRDEILAHFEGDWEMFAEVVGVFRADARIHIRAISDSVSDRDIEGLRAATHTLRGSLSFFGDSSLLSLVDRVRREFDEGLFDRAQATCVHILRQFEAFDASLEAMQDESPTS